MPLLFNSALEYAIRGVQVNQGGLKLKSTLQLSVYGDEINILGNEIYNYREKHSSFGSCQYGDWSTSDC